MGSAQNRVSLAEAEEETTTTSSSSSSSSSSSNSKPGVCNPVPLSGPVTLTEVGLALRETQEQREARIRRLFDFFDVSHGGHLSRSDIERGFRGFSIPLEDEYAKDLMDACDADKDGAVDLGEFRKYVDEKELELYRIFREIDVEHYGCIMAEELRIALLRAGINVNDEELMSFVDHVDKDNNGIITFEEWRDFLLLYPHAATITNIYQYWEKVCLVDIGEQAVIPEGISWKLHATKFFIAGGVAGAVSRTATAPLDRLKVMLQVQTHTKPGTPHTIPAILQIYKEGGPLGFFRGNGINVLKVAPESAIKFYAYDMMKRLVISMDADEEGNGAIGPLGKLFAGGTAGAIAQTVIYPMDLVKTRLQTFACSSERAPSIGRLSRDIWIREGPLTFYRGLLPSLLGMIPYAGIDLAAYETLKDASLRFLPEENNEPGPLVQLVCGMVSGSLGATCVYPLQLVRTRLQAQDSKAPDRYMGMVDVFQRTWKNEGFRAFYKGLMPNLLKVIPAASITYIVYEEMKKRLSI